MDDLINDEDSGSIFESFSDIALCTLAVALLLVTLLAISITQNVNVQINRSKFSGGVMRPSLHLECTVPDFGKTSSPDLALERELFGGQPYVAVHLFSPSLAMIATDVREGGTVALGEDETFAQQQDLSLYQFLQLVPGIEPGSFSADGQDTALLIPSILDKQMVYEPSMEEGYRVSADRMLTKKLLASIWPVYNNPTYLTRRPEEYSRARTRVYVEIQRAVDEEGVENHFVIIGHSAYKLPDALDDGSLAWLGGFSSGLTEIVFLGEHWTDPQMNTNKRIEFFEQNGFERAADAYRAYAFPTVSGRVLQDIYETLSEMDYPENRRVQKARSVAAQIEVSRALLNGPMASQADNDLFPPLLSHRDAWEAYVAHFENEQPDPPPWFYTEFLDRIGFDRLTIEGSLH